QADRLIRPEGFVVALDDTDPSRALRDQLADLVIEIAEQELAAGLDQQVPFPAKQIELAVDDLAEIAGGIKSLAVDTGRPAFMGWGGRGAGDMDFAVEDLDGGGGDGGSAAAQLGTADPFGMQAATLADSEDVFGHRIAVGQPLRRGA